MSSQVITAQHIAKAKLKLQAVTHTVSVIDGFEHWIRNTTEDEKYSKGISIIIEVDKARVDHSIPVWNYIIANNISSISDNHKIVKLCDADRCINPDCWTLVHKSKEPCTEWLDGNWARVSMMIKRHTKTTESGCLEWTAAVVNEGHGVRGNRRARHWVWFLETKTFSIPVNHHVHGTCKNKRCVLFEHLCLKSYVPVAKPEITSDFCNRGKTFLCTRKVISTDGNHHHYLKTNKNPSKKYSSCKFTKIIWFTHKLSWMVHNGRNVPEGQEICHKCDWKGCFNPLHLEAGTSGKNHGPDQIRDGTTARGVRNWNSIITEDTVREIRESKGSGTISERAKRLKVSYDIVSHVDRKDTWYYVEA